ncbi:MAG TPA: phospho-N-acetylmuramoyl-pentapeptide-transferase [Lachnospiraceae bacterium]|nr:phospho-N-acetylmuramoyl-pentapeptide-transferase [Lachnospiraceae bacterium]
MSVDFVREVLPIILSFAIVAILTPFMIPMLRRLKFGQTEREDGPQSHLSKTGTPTMGGIAILIGLLIPSLFYLRTCPEIIPILMMTIGFGVIGCIDDLIKVMKKQSDGLSPLQKMALQFVLTAGFLVYYFLVEKKEAVVHIPFTDMCFTMPVWLFCIFVFFVVLGTVNGTNLTDGLDGLVSGVTCVVAIFFMIVTRNAAPGMEPMSGAMLGALMGFLLFNSHPASVFMGDTGSLAIGGWLSSMCILLYDPLLIIIVGFIYLVEVISDILQVGYFKLTHGKRLFKMAPIHHHFELMGMSEIQIGTMFMVITVILCLVGLLSHPAGL